VSQFREKLIKLAEQDNDAQVDALFEQAQDVLAEQVALFDTPLESQYSAAFAAQVEAKHDQAERIEDKIENQIELQASRLQLAQSRQPNIFALPGARAKWQQQMQQQKSTMQHLQGRLESVREIKEGMGIHGSRIEELATRKFRAQEPELVSDWSDMREAQRQYQALQRKQEQDKKRALEREQLDTRGRSMGLGLSQER